MGPQFFGYQNVPKISQRDVERLLPLYRAGDDAAGRQIVEGNMRFVIYIVLNKYAGTWSRPGAALSADDLIQEGALGLYAALRNYDPARAKFTTHAWYWIREGINRALKSTEIPRGIESDVYDDSPFELEQVADDIDVVHDAEERYIAELLKAEAPKLLALLGTMCKQDRSILQMRLGINSPIRSVSEISVILNFSRRYTHFLEARARQRLRDAWLESFEAHISLDRS